MTPWTVARQAPLSMGFSRQEYWSGLPCPPPGDLPHPGTKLVSRVSCTGRWIFYHQHHLSSFFFPVSLPSFQPCVYSYIYLSTNTLVHSPVHSSVLHLSTRPPVHLSTHPFLHSSSLPPIHFLPPNLSLIWAFQVVGLNRQKSDSFIVVTVFVTRSCLTLCNPMDYIAHQAPLSLEILQQEYSSRALLQRIFLTQGPNPGVLHCRQTLPSEWQPQK